MKRIPFFALMALASTGAVAAAALERTTLPTEWTLSPPSSTMVETGTLPESVTPSADGRHLIVVEGGYNAPVVRILDPATLATERTIPLRGAYGEPLPDRSGSTFWVSEAAEDAIVQLDAANGATLRTIALPKPFWAAAIARSPDGKLLAVSGDKANAVALVDAASGAIVKRVATGHHPAGVVFSGDGKTVFVANWAEASIDAIDVASGATTPIAVGKHPEALLLGPGGTTLFASEADDDAIAIVDIASQKRIADASVGIYRDRAIGASPAAMAISGDGKRLYVACSAANAVAVLDIGGGGTSLSPRGAIPTGWYPTALTVSEDGRALIVADGKGEGSHPNPGLNIFSRTARAANYVAANTVGSIRRIALDDDIVRDGASRVLANAGPSLEAALDDPNARENGPPSNEPGRAIVRRGGPIKHVIYIIKENRTYDQVLGDEGAGNGDDRLAIFNENITPNQHAIAERFGLFDDTYADAQVSADGHNWSTAAFANDYLEKMWPQNYGGRRDAYDFEDRAEGSVPHSGYLWNAAAKAHISLRNYGEFTSDPNAAGNVTTSMPDLAAFTDPRFRGFDLNYSDLDREAEWQREFEAYVRDRDLPQLTILRYPNDHTSGTRPGSLTPQAFVAQNDVAVGKTLEVVSHSPYWSSTAIFVLEDDAQNGPDHVGAQRMPVYIASPYARGGLHHAHHSTAGMVRTIELLLGLAPMSAYDTAALPFYDAFDTSPDMRPFDALPARIDLGAKNTATSYRAAESAKLDFSHEDRADAATLDDIVWHAVKGRNAPLPVLH